MHYFDALFYQEKIALALHDIIYEARPELYNWPSFLDKILLRKVSKISARKAAVIFTCSEFSQKEILKYYQVSPDKVFVIPLAADECFYSQTGSLSSRIKEKYQIKDKFIFYIGSIFNRRHLPEIIQAFGNLTSKLPDYQFLIIGVNHTSPFTPRLSRIKKILRRAQSLKGAGFIDIDGLISQVNQNLNRQVILRKDYSSEEDLTFLYSAADLLIWLSDYEGFGLPILEAMASAVPVITNPAASIPEVAGEAAIYVQDPKNIDEISQAIYRGLTDEQMRQDLIKRGLEQAQKFSWPRCAEKTLRALLDS